MKKSPEVSPNSLFYRLRILEFSLGTVICSKERK
jgi:hypothetical protein